MSKGSPIVSLTEEQLELLLAKAVAAAPAGTNGVVNSYGLSEAALEQTIASSTKIAVTECLTAFGIDTSNPIEAQKDFAFIRYMRLGSESIKSHGMKVVAGAVLTAVTSLVVWALKTFFARR